MSSDPRPLPDALARLADVLAEAAGGPRPTALELAELLWLARRMGPPDDAAPTPAPPPHEPARDQPAGDEPEPPRAQPPPPSADEEPPPAPPRAPLHLPAPRPAPGAPLAPHASLLAPAPPMLPHPLALQRALRPLGRRVDAPTGRELDERATAERIARLGAGPDWWLPVLRPVRERWLRLHLVADAGPTMPVWRPLVRELHTTLAQSGLFRDVTVLRADADGTVHGPAAPPDGRTVLLLVSDCMGPQWRQGPAGTRWYAILRRWAARMPLAVLQPLPEHLWRDTALPTVPGRLSAPHPAAPAAALTFTPYEPPDPYEADPAAVLPVLEPGPRWLANWAALLAAPGRTEVPAAGAVLGRPLPADAGERTDVSRLSAEELVLRFRATASPEAVRLASHLAVGRPHLPVMRLVQRAVDPDPRPQHLAEVILSGMLTTVLGPPGCYAFRPGVRELLLRGLPRSARGRTTELLERVGGLIDTAAGRAPGEFRASTPTASGRPAHVDGEPFAHVSRASVRRLAEDAAEKRLPQTLSFLTDSLTGRPEARITLEAAVHDVLSRSLAPQHYEMTARPDGYLVRVDPGVSLLPLLAAVVRTFPDVLAGRPRLRVAFSPDDLPGQLPAGRGVAVPPQLYEQFAASSAAARPPRFRPVFGPRPDSPPRAWYCPLSADDAPGGDLVRGPFITGDLRTLGMPAPGRTALVHLAADGPLTLLDPARPAGTAGVTTYYEVDLTPHQDRHEMTLPSSGKGDFAAVVELSWRVEDPVAFVHAQASDVAGRLLAHVREQAARVTARHPTRRAVGAERALRDALGRGPVPGLAVRCSVRLSPAWGPAPDPGPPAVTADTPPGELLARAASVLVGFDGPVARLFSSAAAREAALDLLALVSEHRDPEDALTGRPLAVEAAREASVHPLEVLRAFAHDRLGPLLSERLDELELRAVPDAPTTHHVVPLIRALHASGRRVCVVSDAGETAVRRYLEPYGLPLDGVYGRGAHPGLVTPDPESLLPALGDRPPSAAVLIGSSPSEFTAARRLGLPFVGLARTPTQERRLREAGCKLTVRSLEPLLAAARTLPPP
ncbi:SAV_2336 N-terminal domain-related protein [Streptomyces sp. NPDC058731]|uniref:SAV_2336 N-terminal domain-related protein n=1 Tax=Streptomyces sp. NPDC058731 TaxID=3346613 RepID=UPI0036ABD11F